MTGVLLGGRFGFHGGDGFDGFGNGLVFDLFGGEAGGRQGGDGFGLAFAERGSERIGCGREIGGGGAGGGLRGSVGDGDFDNFFSGGNWDRLSDRDGRCGGIRRNWCGWGGLGDGQMVTFVDAGETLAVDLLGESLAASEAGGLDVGGRDHRSIIDGGALDIFAIKSRGFLDRLMDVRTVMVIGL